MNEFSINVNVTVDAPTLVQAINSFAAAFSGNRVADVTQTATAAPAQQPQPVPQSQPIAQALAASAPPAAPVQQPQPMPQQAPQPMPQQAPQPMPQQAPQPMPQPQHDPQPQPSRGVTLDAIINAGAGLVEKGMMAQVVALLGKYGLQAVNQLQPEQYAPFAAELRALGAAI